MPSASGRGLAASSPTGARATTTRVLLDQVQAVLDEYAEHLPLTNRQIFYRLVGAHGYPKTRASLQQPLRDAAKGSPLAHDSVCRHPRRRRHAQHELSDATTGVEDFLETTRRRRAEDYPARPAAKDQAARLMLWCEAGGMVPQLG